MVWRHLGKWERKDVRSVPEESKPVAQPTNPEHTVIHAKGRPCPEGYVLVPGMFTAPDGTREDAYVKPGAPICIDFIPGHGSVSLGFKIIHRERPETAPLPPEGASPTKKEN